MIPVSTLRQIARQRLDLFFPVASLGPRLVATRGVRLRLRRRLARTTLQLRDALGDTRNIGLDLEKMPVHVKRLIDESLLHVEFGERPRVHGLVGIRLRVILALGIGQQL